MCCALHDQLGSLDGHAQLTRCFSAVAELLVSFIGRFQQTSLNFHCLLNPTVRFYGCPSYPANLPQTEGVGRSKFIYSLDLRLTVLSHGSFVSSGSRSIRPCCCAALRSNCQWRHWLWLSVGYVNEAGVARRWLQVSSQPSVSSVVDCRLRRSMSYKHWLNYFRRARACLIDELRVQHPDDWPGRLGVLHVCFDLSLLCPRRHGSSCWFLA